MLRSNFDKINVTDIDVLEKASLNVQKVFNLYLELIFILDYLETSRFSYYFQNRTNLRPKEVGKIIKNAVLKYINELNFDLNNFKEKVGCFYFKKREDKLKVKDIDLENDTYLAFVTWRPFPREEKFLSLSAYFSFRIDAITSSFKEIHWDQLDEAIPAFFAGIFMALCYSISYGIAAGFVFYCIVKICKGKAKEVHPILWVCTGLFVLNFVLLACL